TLLHALISAPVFLYLVALTAMLFRTPDVKTFPLDRLMFVLLVVAVGARWCIRRLTFRPYAVTWPMLAMLLLGVLGTVTQPYDSQSWSLLAAKWIIPVTLFHFAGGVFSDETSRRKLEIFCIAVLVYLSLMSIFFFVDLRSFIFPRFILDEGIGIH